MGNILPSPELISQAKRDMFNSEGYLMMKKIHHNLLSEAVMGNFVFTSETFERIQSREELELILLLKEQQNIFMRQFFKTYSVLFSQDWIDEHLKLEP